MASSVRVMMKLLLLTLTMFSLFTASAQDSFLAKPYPAPTPAATDETGAPLNLAEVYAKGLTVIFFYPKASTPGCTAQACSLRDAFKDLGKLGIQVIGVSRDTAANQQAFKKSKNLPYPLIPDVDGKVVDAFGVKKAIPLLSYAAREAFIIKGGQVVWHDPSAATTDQAKEIKEAVEKLK